MIKTGNKLWNKLQKAGFFTKDQYTTELAKIYERHMFGNRLIRWRINGFKFPLQDVRKCFEQSLDEDKELLEYYVDCLTHTEGQIDLDQTVIKVVLKVNKRLTYVTDQENYGKTEFWAKPIDIHRKMTDDCDGYAVLTCYVCGLLGVPSFRRFVRGGYVTGKNGLVGHATFIYLSTRTNEFYPLEGSWYPIKSIVNFDVVPLRKNESYCNTWWITNENKSYGVSPLLQII